MARNQWHLNSPEKLQSTLPIADPFSKPKDVAELLRLVESLLSENRPTKAIEAVRLSKFSSVWIRNAAGVCHLRLGNVRSAVDVYRGFVLTPNNLMLRSDIPIVFKSNFATALIQDGNIPGCLNALGNCTATDHPAVGRLRMAIAEWKKGLTLWQRFNWFTGIQPDVPVVLNFPPGDLE